MVGVGCIGEETLEQFEHDNELEEFSNGYGQ